MLRLKILFITILVIGASFFALEASANHTWFNYHWARTSNPFTIQLGDNVGSAWDSHLLSASAGWSFSSVLDAIVVSGRTNSRNCKPISGRVEVCNNRYGNNGWLGIASVWVGGGHIVQGTVKMNDTYFNTARYNTPEWRQFVMCQEIGHTFGLDHQDEDHSNTNLNTCMDYTNNPFSNQTPNQHDYEMLETIYAHLDSIGTVAPYTASASSNEIDHDNRSTWGQSIRTSKDGKASLYVKETKDGSVFTFVIWAE